MRPAPGHGARAVGKKAKKKPEATSAGEAPVPDPGEGATLAQPEGAPGPAEGAAGPPALSAAPLPLDGLPAPDLGAFFELTFPDKRLLALCHDLGLHTPGSRLEALPPGRAARVAARGEIAQREQRLAEERAEHVQARAEVARLAAEVARLSAAGEGRALADARKYADEARALSEKLRTSEEARQAVEERAASLSRRLAQAPAQPKAVPVPEEEDLP